MFQVPNHLPRASTQTSDPTSNPELNKPDLTLDLLSPFFTDPNSAAGPSRRTAEQATAAREKLEKAVKDTKSKINSLLLENYASISSHIQLANTLQSDHARISSRLRRLEEEIDPTNPSTSFLTAVILQLESHCTSRNKRSRAESHVTALKALQKQADHVQKLEDAIWGGKGADDWVVEALGNSNMNLNEDIEGIKGTKIYSTIQTRIQLFRSMLLEQLSEGVSSSISLLPSSLKRKDTVLSVFSPIQLKEPRIPRSDSSTSTSDPTPTTYSMPHLYSTLDRLNILSPQLSSLSTRLIRDIVRPLLDPESKSRLVLSTTPSSSELTLTSTSANITSPSDKIHDLQILFEFISTTLFPTLPTDSSSSLIQVRNSFISNLTSSILTLLLDIVLIPSMPAQIKDLPSWLELLNQASTLESSLTSHHTSLSSNSEIIKSFIDTRAGKVWVESRTKSAMEECKNLVSTGWAGWDAMEVTREKEVVVMIEVEVEDESVPASGVDGVEKGMEVDGEDEEDGWGLDSPIASTNPEISGIEKEKDEDGGGEDAWGFDEEVSATFQLPDKEKERETKKKGVEESGGGGDGWDFDFEPSTSPKSTAPLVGTASSPTTKKPVREAKKLGKRVAKAKQAETKEEEEEDLMISLNENTHSQVQVEDGGDRDGWGWDEPPSAPKPISKSTLTPISIITLPQPPKPKRMVLREEKRTVVESYLVSKACEKLLELLRRCLVESEELASSSLPETFTSTQSQLLQIAPLVLDTFRALIPLSSSQIKDVPVLSIQLSNDFAYISSKLPELSSSSSPPSSSSSTPSTSQPNSTQPSSMQPDVKSPTTWNCTDQQRRLIAASEHIYEDQLQRQSQGLMSLIDEAQGFEGSGLVLGQKRCEGVMGGLSDRLDSLSRVLKVVMPSSTFYPTMGYLIDIVLARICTEILSLQDITENESEKLDELLRKLYPLEEIFKDNDPPTSIITLVPHWLKYNYISELLHANLIDITYLYDSGALIDFTTGELVSFIKALFADSEKRDRAIETIESGVSGDKAEGN